MAAGVALDVHKAVLEPTGLQVVVELLLDERGQRATVGFEPSEKLRIVRLDDPIERGFFGAAPLMVGRRRKRSGTPRILLPACALSMWNTETRCSDVIYSSSVRDVPLKYRPQCHIRFRKFCQLGWNLIAGPLAGRPMPSRSPAHSLWLVPLLPQIPRMASSSPVRWLPQEPPCMLVGFARG